MPQCQETEEFRSTLLQRHHPDVSKELNQLVTSVCQDTNDRDERRWCPVPTHFLSSPSTSAWQMSKIKHLIHKVTSVTSSKRGSLENVVRDEGTVEATGHQNVIGFAEATGEAHPPPHHHHGRRRDRSLSLTEEKALRSEAREAAEAIEKQRHDAEKKRAYDEVRSSFVSCGPSPSATVPRIL